MNKKDGYKCACGKFTKYPGYMYAHWNERLVQTCACGRKNYVQAGEVEIGDAPKPLSADKASVDGHLA